MGKQRQVGHCPDCWNDSDGHMACWCNNECCDDRWERQVNTRQVNIHTDKYVEQLINWGFSLDFIALDAGIDLDSLKMRFRRKAKRENWNEHQRSKFGISSCCDDSGCCKEA